MTEIQWCCPWCGNDQIAKMVTWKSPDAHVQKRVGKYPGLQMAVNWIICQNPDCREVAMCAWIDQVEVDILSQYSKETNRERLQSWQLWPDSKARPWPDYIPETVRSSYEQACYCEERAPAASATMARRALHEILKDFCGAKGKNLAEDIERLRKQVREGSGPDGVPPETVDRLHQLREMGNIGAHLIRGTDEIIIDIEGEEPRLLIEMIELLAEQWYVQREQRRGLNQRFDDMFKNKQSRITVSEGEDESA